ncbi:uncharacterized protein FIESC28_03858 [Fusarium coffeatum]|uniref:HECT-type E3 ubiquitin transferase n=1 Tax=Fusarium coffeatum TaxID=231269 RepID=A0A366S3Q8_9HYPO|nr:uncharacterized protein FIESC28_03858 [Fusarium coffeatum]RBR23275.1 hypothetical protein FIESC28_03858 [Fusarium coffeatum]
MTPDAYRPRDPSIDFAADIDLLAGLWQEAPFARLPSDAPSEVKAAVQSLENPTRVYAIHQASRRHGFQLLVERYIFQLRYGCENVNCATPTCFTCRRRLASKAPIRRYNTTSARTLATYLASQDDPEEGLCPFLRKSTEPPTTINNLIFSTRSPSPSHPDDKRANVATSPGARKNRASRPRTSSSSSQDSIHGNRRAPHSTDGYSASQIRVIEGPVNKDHRSFAANLFGTVTFKMLDWLTPKGVAAISEKLGSFEASESTAPVLDQDTLQESSSLTSTNTDLEVRKVLPQEPSPQKPTKVADQPQETDWDEPPFPAKPPRSRHDSTNKPQNNAIAKPRKCSIDTTDLTKGDDGSKAARLPQMNGHLRNKSLRHKNNKHAPISSMPELPSRPGFFENVTKPPTEPVLSNPPLTLRDDVVNETKLRSDQSDGRARNDTNQEIQDHEAEPRAVTTDDPNRMLPQVLPKLDVNLVDLICDVYEEDGTSEPCLLAAHRTTYPYPQPVGEREHLRRDSTLSKAWSRKQWLRFNEQTLFFILTDPQAVVQSFTQDQKLYDSQTLWYCFHRLSRVTSSLVFHSLWLAAARLFIPPPELESNTSPRRASSTKPLCDLDAGYLMSICMHALVAATPVISDSRTLYELSRVRSNGLTLAGGSAISRQPSSRCLDYDDAFSNDIAIRLARRLFCAITARRCFVDRVFPASQLENSEMKDVDILRPLVNQLDFLSTGSASILEFPRDERLLHETRVPTVLLDWARTVLLTDWDGRADFAMDGPFGGALSFIETLHKSRNLLLLGDVQFRVDYISERLDSIEMPVEWLSFKSTRWRRHILDYPYVFSPETLVSFFRSINFARMSRMFEESSSLKTRMNAIVDPGSLITNPHHKMVLQDLLRTASSKYLVLEVGRENVARDAFDQLWRRERRELLRPLKVHLGENSGEEGFDSGGVQQEFFRLAIAECLDPEFGAFTVDERTRMAWFTPGSLTEDWKFELVGLLMSLALYNGLTLPVTFPRALYRKLLGKPVKELHHIADGWPDLASGLTTLLEWDEKNGLVEDVFARTYEFSVSSLGTITTREMRADKTTNWPSAASGSTEIRPPHMDNPDDAPLVTNKNRDDYIIDYIRYLTDVSIRRQYLAFERGFASCLHKKSLSLLCPSTLQSLVEGEQEIDIAELKRYTRYVGWDTSHRTIKDFWSIVKRYDQGMKQRLLEFVTSSDRVPVGGMKNLQFVIQKNGEEDGTGGHLPTAYTCYGTLLLPEYRDKEVLRERLGMALQNAQGFGFA